MRVCVYIYVCVCVYVSVCPCVCLWEHAINVFVHLFDCRFATKTVAEKQLMPTCQERQLNDFMEMAGTRVSVPHSEPVKGQVQYTSNACNIFDVSCLVQVLFLYLCLGFVCENTIYFVWFG
jgi:hypothetical protein